VAKKVNVDIRMVDLALSELGKLIIKLEKDPDTSEKRKRLIRKIENIRNDLQDAVVFAKLEKSVKA
jgi:hypothetical protein